MSDLDELGMNVFFKLLHEILKEENIINGSGGGLAFFFIELGGKFVIKKLLDTSVAELMYKTMDIHGELHLATARTALKHAGDATSEEGKLEHRRAAGSNIIAAYESYSKASQSESAKVSSYYNAATTALLAAKIYKDLKTTIKASHQYAESAKKHMGEYVIVAEAIARQEREGNSSAPGYACAAAGGFLGPIGVLVGTGIGMGVTWAVSGHHQKIYEERVNNLLKQYEDFEKSYDEIIAR